MAETGGASEIGQGSTTNNNNNNIYHSIPRGGPLYLSNLVGSLTKPPVFQSHLLSELKVLIKPTQLFCSSCICMYVCLCVMQLYIIRLLSFYLGS